MCTVSSSVKPVYDISVRYNFKLNCYNVTYKTEKETLKGIQYYNNIHMPCSTFIFYSSGNSVGIPNNDYCENFFIQRVKLRSNPESREYSEKVEHYSEKIVLTTTAAPYFKEKKQRRKQSKAFIPSKFT